MTETWALASLWLGLALVATLLSVWFRVATALSEIVVGIVAQLVIGAVIGGTALGADQSWVRFLSGTGAIMLTFLAGAELDPQVMCEEWKKAAAIGLAGFFAPFFGCAAICRYLLGWTPAASWLTGVALSTTSVAVVYAVMLEYGLNATHFGKVLLAACFINDLGTVLALGLIFSPFSIRTGIFAAVSIAIFVILPRVTPIIFHRYGGRPSEIESKYLLLCLFGLGALAAWAESEAVLPAYLVGMVLAGSVGTDHVLIRRLRTLTLGFLTPFYFIRAGSFVSVAALAAAPLCFVVLIAAKIATKFIAVYPTARWCGHTKNDAMYTTSLMSTGLTFGSISAMFGLSHGIITTAEYSYIVASVVASAVVPTLIANAFFLPKHLVKSREDVLPAPIPEPALAQAEGGGED